MTPAATLALLAVFAAFVVGLLWRLARGDLRDVWLLCVPVAAFAATALRTPDYRPWELAGCLTAVAALSVGPLVSGRKAVSGHAQRPVRDPDGADIPLARVAASGLPPRARRRHGRAIFAALILLDLAIVGVAFLSSAGWYDYDVSRSMAASERCLRSSGGAGTPTASAAGYGAHVLAVHAPGGLRGSAVFLSTPGSARRFAGNMAASTSLQARQRGPIVLVTPRPLDGPELRRLASCLTVVEVEQLSNVVGAPFVRAKHPFGQAHRQ
jgi:hypothetical protein